MSDCDIFVSYAHEDRDRVLPIVNALEAEGWSVFWDRTLPPGESWRSYIGARLRNAPVILVVWSKDSIESEWVAQEAEHASARRALIPVLIDAVLPPLGLGHVQSADLVEWLKQGQTQFPAHLRKAIASRIGTPVAAAPVKSPVAPAAPAPLPPPAVAAPMSPPRRSALRALLPVTLLVLGAAAVGAAAVHWLQPATTSGKNDKVATAPAPAPAAAPKSCTFDAASVRHGATVVAYQSSSAPFGTACISEQRACQDGALSGSYGFSACTVASAPPPPPPAPRDCPMGSTVIAHGATLTAYRTAASAPGAACERERRTCADGVLSGSFGFTSCTATPAPPKTCRFGTATIAHGGSTVAYKTSSVAFGSTCESERRTCQDGTLTGSFGFNACSVAAAPPPPPKDCPMGATVIAHGATITAYRSERPDGACESERRTCQDGSLSGSYGFTSCTVAAAPAGAAPAGPAPAPAAAAPAANLKSCRFGTSTLRHGASVTAYRNSMAYNEACTWEQRTCQDGVLSGTFAFAGCTIEGPNPQQNWIEAATRWGLIGSWAANCNAYTRVNPLSTYVVRGEQILRDRDFGDGRESVVLADFKIRQVGDIEFTEPGGAQRRQVVLTRGSDGRIRVYSLQDLATGQYTVQAGMLASNNRETAWLTRCR